MAGVVCLFYVHLPNWKLLPLGQHIYKENRIIREPSHAFSILRSVFMLFMLDGGGVLKYTFSGSVVSQDVCRQGFAVFVLKSGMEGYHGTLFESLQ